MFDKFLTDLKSPRISYEISDDIFSQKLGEYYFLFREKRISKGKDQKLINRFDENGIPINKTYIDVTDQDFVYFPISIGQMGLSVYHTYLETGSKKDIERFLKFVDWFNENAETSKINGARWLTDVSLPQYRNPGPWQSAFAQSRGISILLRGFQLTNNEKFAEIAKQALIPFTKPVSEGGVTSYTKWGPFYEEYTASVPTLVLNGMIFSMCGIFDFLRVFPEDTLAKKLFDEGILTLKNILPEFDLGFWSRYNLCSADWHPQIDPATIGYQRLHITQLELLYRLTKEAVFKDFSQKFREQDNLLNALKMYKLKFRALRKNKRL